MKKIKKIEPAAPEKILYFRAVDHRGHTHFDVPASKLVEFKILLRGDWTITFYFK